VLEEARAPPSFRSFHSAFDAARQPWSRQPLKLRRQTKLLLQELVKVGKASLQATWELGWGLAKPNQDLQEPADSRSQNCKWKIAKVPADGFLAGNLQ